MPTTRQRPATGRSAALGDEPAGHFGRARLSLAKKDGFLHSSRVQPAESSLGASTTSKVPYRGN